MAVWENIAGRWSSDRWYKNLPVKDERIMKIYKYTQWILHCSKKWYNHVNYSGMDDTRKYHSKWSKPEEEGYIRDGITYTWYFRIIALGVQWFKWGLPRTLLVPEHIEKERYIKKIWEITGDPVKGIQVLQWC